MHSCLRPFQSIHFQRPRAMGPLLMLVLFAILVSPNAYAWSNGHPAKLVLGQSDFASHIANKGGISAKTLSSPRDIAIDPTTGKVFVTDSGNNRVLRFAAVAALTNGAAAEAVLGQTTFITNTANSGGISASTMSNPSGVAVDAAGRLWVAELI